MKKNISFFVFIILLVVTILVLGNFYKKGQAVKQANQKIQQQTEAIDELSKMTNDEFVTAYQQVLETPIDEWEGKYGKDYSAKVDAEYKKRAKSFTPEQLKILTKVWESVQPFQGLQIVEDSITTEDGKRYIAGKLLNKSKSQYSYVIITIDLFDAKGNLVDNTLAQTTNLVPDSSWDFKVEITKDTISYKFKDITGKP